MSDGALRSSTDWLASIRSSALAWWLPQCAIVAALFLPVPARMAIWVIGLAWMGTACLVNARRCGRTHCRFTGPYYLALIFPVLALGSGAVPLGFPAWLALGGLILIGSKIIWWATERALGRFS
jgi:hypothetical protein